MSSFRQIDTWVFDLDNTLYPASCRLFDQMHVKMGEYVMRRFGVEYPEAKRIQKQLYLKHGTTLRGLMVEHGEAPEDFLHHVHDIDYSAVPESPELAAALDRLPGRKLVFTAGTAGHAARAMARLGVVAQFDGIYDIVAADHIPKPAREPYDKFLLEHDVEPGRAAFFEDIARNLEVPHAMGMTTVLVTSDQSYDDEMGQMNHVHHRTPDLTEFLKTLSLGNVGD
jgi:putative hydrolase of the HAD superfamily